MMDAIVVVYIILLALGFAIAVTCDRRRRVRRRLVRQHTTEHIRRGD